MIKHLKPFKNKFILLAFLATCCVALQSCSNDVEGFSKTIDRSILNSEKANDVTIFYSKEGHTRAKLQTPVFNHMQQSNPTYIEMPKGLVVEFYDDSLQVSSTLSSKYGKLFEDSNNVLVRDSVVVRNNKNEQLNTEELVWNEKMQRFFTEKFVKITTPTQIIYGDGLESNQNFTEYKIINVKGVIGVNKNTLPQ